MLAKPGVVLGLAKSPSGAERLAMLLLITHFSVLPGLSVKGDAECFSKISSASALVNVSTTGPVFVGGAARMISRLMRLQNCRICGDVLMQGLVTPSEDFVPVVNVSVLF